MARLAIAGFDLAVNEAGFSASGGAPPTRDTSHQRSGAGCAACNSGAGNVNSVLTFLNQRTSTTVFARAYYRVDNLPGSTVQILGDGLSYSVRLTAAGNLQLWSATQIGSDSAATLATDGTYYRIEIKETFDAGGLITLLELSLEGVVVATSGVLSLTAGTSLQLGWINAPGANAALYVDDFAVNDNTGASQTGYPGSGKVVALVPTADSAKGTGWVNDANAVTNFFNATKNTPPQGIAQTTASTGLHQIQNATANANSSYDATLTTYTAAGVGAGDTITLVVAITYTGAPVTTSAKQGTVGVVSNPAITNVALGALGTSGAFWEGNTAGTWPSGWKWSLGTFTYAPSVTLGTAPVARITQVTSSTRIAMCCLLGIYVEYVPAAVAVLPIPNVNMAAQGLTS